MSVKDIPETAKYIDYEVYLDRMKESNEPASQTEKGRAIIIIAPEILDEMLCRSHILHVQITSPLPEDAVLVDCFGRGLFGHRHMALVYESVEFPVEEKPEDWLVIQSPRCENIRRESSVEILKRFGLTGGSVFPRSKT